MTYTWQVNAMGSYTIWSKQQVIATVYVEGMAIRICRLLNENGEGQ